MSYKRWGVHTKYGGEVQKEEPPDRQGARYHLLVVEFNTTPNAHPEVMRKWAEKINVSE